MRTPEEYLDSGEEQGDKDPPRKDDVVDGPACLESGVSPL